ncbi:N-acetylmuramoyl-L-alanine amidase [Nocardia sp. NPDC058519]|uniref:peptidoglycan recognition protein family protein n=1 Tax=Nocardia sp. NPDC058519 TaxID=3346535 RepID=UPI0036657970
MPWTGDPVWLADVLRAEGVQVVEYPDWRERGHGDFRSVWGVICHHTGGSNTPPREIAEGFAHLPGPLSQIHLGKDGTATVVAVGVAWHAGMGEYPGLPEDNANWHTIGIEAANNGTEGWAPAQYQAYVRCCAAIVRRLGYGADRVIGHKEWAGAKQGKWDPGQMDMAKFRRDVQAQLDRKAPIMDANQAAGLALDQLGGPGTKDGKNFVGWPQLGGRTVVNALAAIGQKLGIDGFDPKAK